MPEIGSGLAVSERYALPGVASPFFSREPRRAFAEEDPLRTFPRHLGPAATGAAIVCVCLGIAVVSFGQQSGSPAASAPTVDRPAAAGLDPSDLDRAAAACQDFYRYADGGWLKKNPIPPEYPSWGTFNELAERNREVLHRILERTAKDRSAEKGSDEQKIGDFYSSCMDEAAIEAQGTRPLQPELGRIARIANLQDLQAEVARLQTSGVNALFQFGSEQDRKKSTDVIATAAQGGLGLPDRDYYTKTDDASKKTREQYVAHVAKMFRLMGENAARAAAGAATVMAIETKLAEASMTNVEQRHRDSSAVGLQLLPAMESSVSAPTSTPPQSVPGDRSA